MIQRLLPALAVVALAAGCSQQEPPAATIASANRAQPAPSSDLPAKDFLNPPLITELYTADPSAHVFDGKLYIYPSHDIASNIQPGPAGDHFDMKDYHVFSLDQAGGPVTDHGEVLHVGQVPWATRQLWAPDAAEKDGRYYLYFPAKDSRDVFRIGVAIADNPAGPFLPEAKPIPGTYSIDPAVFQDDDGKYYLYVGGIRGGQLQRWQSGSYAEEDSYPADDQPTLLPRMAQLGPDMKNLVHPLTDIAILDENGNLIVQGDRDRMFFEAAWVHKYQGTYYLSYSTGDTHFIQYATASNPYGPFTWQGKILEPVLGWTNHHSIVEFQGKWYLFYHDSQLSGGETHLRNVKMTELVHNADGTIQTIDSYLAD